LYIFLAIWEEVSTEGIAAGFVETQKREAILFLMGVNEVTFAYVP
jgi:hypothetical protein